MKQESGFAVAGVAVRDVSGDSANNDLADRFKVYVVDDKAARRHRFTRGFEPGNQPPLAGEYLLAIKCGLCPDWITGFLTPDYPLDPDSNYIAVYHPLQKNAKRVTRLFGRRANRVRPSAQVRNVFPSTDVLPENLLKFYIEFSEPMRRGEVYQFIDLVDQEGRKVEIPFLEVAEELWNPDGTRLTLFIDPGRVKREVKPLEDVGPAMVHGGRYSLVISREWPDQNGASMIREYRKEFRVGPPDRTQPDIKKWKLFPPKAGTREHLIVEFEESMERALLDRLLWVEDSKGNELKGGIIVSDHESRWEFAPDENWGESTYRLVADEWLEDLAGNRIGRPFEVDIFDKVTERIEVKTVSRSFHAVK